MARWSLWVVALVALGAPRSFAGEQQGREPGLGSNGTVNRLKGGSAECRSVSVYVELDQDVAGSGQTSP
jgi:hypothetical protein